MNTLFDLLNTLEQSSYIGFDNMFSNIRSYGYPKRSNYPPHNILRQGDNYLIQVAVAGFNQNDIEIETKNGELIVSGSVKSEANEDVEFLARGIAARNFKLSFALADTIIVDGAEMKNGMLNIALHNEIPEERRPKKIEIGELNADTRKLLLG